MIEYINASSGDKKIIAFGNPPYQESDGGFGKSAKNIYPFFVESLINSKSIREFSLLIPSRWFSGGKGLDNFRRNMMSSPHLQQVKHYQEAYSIFPNVDINGGVCFLHFNKDYKGSTKFSNGEHIENIFLDELDVIPDEPYAFKIIKKVKSNWQGQYVSDKAWASSPFGLRTDYFNKHKKISKNTPFAIPCMSKGRILNYVAIQNILKNTNRINSWKVAVPKAVGGKKGKRRSTIPVNQIFLINKGIVTTETYNIIDTFKTKNEAENFIKYLQTDFSRYIVGLRKMTQDMSQDKWNWLPYLDMSISWDNDKLYKLFNITKKEQVYIKKKVEDWS